MTTLHHRIRDVTRRGGRRTAIVAASAIALAVGVVAVEGAGGAPLRAPVPMSLRPPAALEIDVTNSAPDARRISRSAATWPGGPTRAASGEIVTVFVSSALPAELGTPLTWADFLASLAHGPELPLLTAYIGTLDEVQEICGPDSLGCYAGNQLVAIGETAFGITAAEVVRHEYGHHIAANRQNPPWLAVDWGPKRWASTMNVCRRTSEGSAYPGDEDSHYRLNPGEAWAETYRLMDEHRTGVTGSGWPIVDGSFYPDALALQVAEQDVVQPWTASTRTVLRTRFTPRSKRVWSIPIATPLDGSIVIRVTFPKGGLYDVVLVAADGKRLAAGLWSGTTVKTVSTTVCGPRSLRLEVTQRGAYGRVVAVVERP